MATSPTTNNNMNVSSMLEQADELCNQTLPEFLKALDDAQPSEVISSTTSLSSSMKKTEKNTSKKAVTKTIADKRRKRTVKKKKEGRPKRPLSAYNLFFQDERAKITGTSSPSSLSSSSSSSSIVTNDTITTLSSEEQQQQQKKKRKHIKTHGVISFTDLAKTIGMKWKNLDEETRLLYEGRAKILKGQHAIKVAEWKKNLLLKEAAQAEKKAKAHLISKMMKKENQDIVMNNNIDEVVVTTKEDPQDQEELQLSKQDKNIDKNNTPSSIPSLSSVLTCAFNKDKNQVVRNPLFQVAATPGQLPSLDTLLQSSLADIDDNDLSNVFNDEKEEEEDINNKVIHAAVTTTNAATRLKELQQQFQQCNKNNNGEDNNATILRPLLGIVLDLLKEQDNNNNNCSSTSAASSTDLNQQKTLINALTIANTNQLTMPPPFSLQQLPSQQQQQQRRISRTSFSDINNNININFDDSINNSSWIPEFQELMFENDQNTFSDFNMSCTSTSMMNMDDIEKQIPL